jgi:hypothetical protein
LGEGGDEWGELGVKGVKAKVEAGEMGCEEALRRERAGMGRASLVKWLELRMEREASGVPF